MKFLTFLLIALMLVGCVLPIKTTKEIDILGVQDINVHPYQIVGYYQEDKDGYTTRVILNRHWVEEINKDKYHLEFIIKKPSTRYKF